MHLLATFIIGDPAIPLRPMISLSREREEDSPTVLTLPKRASSYVQRLNDRPPPTRRIPPLQSQLLPKRLAHSNSSRSRRACNHRLVKLQQRLQIQLQPTVKGTPQHNHSYYGSLGGKWGECGDCQLLELCQACRFEY